MSEENPKSALPSDRSFSIAAALEDVGVELLAGAGNLDFYAGYNLAASIDERLDEIGILDSSEPTAQSTDDGQYVYARVNRDGRATAMNRLVLLRAKALDAIAAAKDIESS